MSAAKSRHAVFHKLAVASVEPITDDSVAITFAVPDDLAGEYRFDAGQHLTVRCELAGDTVRRNYSICSSAVSGPLRVGVKRLPGGVFSTFACEQLQAGDVMEVMTPSGRFTVPFDRTNQKHYAAIAAGSGITPILSIVGTALEVEPHSRVTLVYGNRTSNSVMFGDELADLKDRYLSRLQIVHVLSRERGEAALGNGRIDAAKLATLFDTVLPPDSVDEWFMCGPLEMTDQARDTLLERGVEPGRLHRELFFVDAPPPVPSEVALPAGTAEVTVSLDGRGSTFDLAPDGDTILEAFLAVRREAPYACKNGMCGTCRALVVEGDVRMDRNYALEAEELQAGFVLACQAHPTSERVSLDFDA